MRHPLAVLRLKLGMYQQEFADLLRCSKPTIQKIEHGHLPLSESLAQRVFHETGVSLGWLLGGNPKARIVTGQGEPWSPETFERAQAGKTHFDKPHPAFFSSDFLGFAGRLRAILASAQKRKDYYLASYRVGKFLDTLAADFGADSNEATNWQHFIPAIQADIAAADRLHSPVRDLLASIAPKANGAPFKKPSARSSSRPRRKD